MRATTTSAVILCGALLCFVAVSDALKCDFFKITTGYLEADSQIACKSWNSLDEAKAECLNNPECDGFSFSKKGPPYSGCLKKNRVKNYNPNKDYDGYHKTLMGCSCARNYEPDTDICGPRELAVVSVGKPATQSTLAWGGVPSRAVDGNKSPDWSSSSCTATDLGKSNPWWTVDLGETFEIEKVEILNRLDCCSERLSNAEIRVGDSSDFMQNDICLDGLNFGPGETRSIECKMKGRYVTVRVLKPDAILTLCEVSVFAWVPEATLTPAQLFGLTPRQYAIEFDQPFFEEFEQVPGEEKSESIEVELLQEMERAGMPPPEGY